MSLVHRDGMTIYHNRQDAGQTLARLLGAYANRPDLIVLALPRGGVPVAYEIAQALHAPLDVFIVRKLGVPTHPELAMGALAEGGQVLVNAEIVRDCQVSAVGFEKVKAVETQELKRRQMRYRGDRPFPNIENKTIILVDDGVATGASLHAAIDALKLFHPKRFIVAVPVASPDIVAVLAPLVDDFICPLQPDYLNAVGAWYDDFPQTEDEEVKRLLGRV